MRESLRRVIKCYTFPSASLLDAYKLYPAMRLLGINNSNVWDVEKLHSKKKNREHPSYVVTRLLESELGERDGY